MWQNLEQNSFTYENFNCTCISHFWSVQVGKRKRKIREKNKGRERTW